MATTSADSTLALAPLDDALGRTMRDLRISVTDKCNLRCRYCMPAEGLTWLARDELLTFEEIARVAGLFAAMGVGDIRLTGGEPLARRELHKLVAMLSRLDGVNEIALTTNGLSLARQIDDLVAAGLTRVNVSLDSLARDRYEQITRRDAIGPVMRGIKALERYPQLAPIKINAVAMRGFSELEVLDFAELARRKPYVVRFIEFMPLDADQAWTDDAVLTGAEILAIIESRYPMQMLNREPGATSKRYRFVDGIGEIGLISPVSEPFCSDCDRLRITAEGKLRTCLFSKRETDLRDPLRSGASDFELEQILRDAVWRKEQKHSVGEVGFVPPARSMSRIGG